MFFETMTPRQSLLESSPVHKGVVALPQVALRRERLAKNMLQCSIETLM